MFFGFQHLLYFADLRLGWVDPDVRRQSDTANGYLIYASAYGLLGGLTVAFADSIVGLAYPIKDTDSPDEEGDTLD